MKFIIPMIVGAVIGYATNWLAIKMLFRPHYEKKLLGIKIPFTPGLIPKEKKRIAKNIGEAVGEYLLSPKAIEEALLNGNTEKQVKSWIGQGVNRLKEDEKSIKDLLLDIFEEKYKDIIQKMEKLIYALVIKLMKSKRLKEKILDFIRKKLHDEKTYEEISKNIRVVLDKALESKILEGTIEKNIEKEFQKMSGDRRIVKNVLPEKVKWEIDIYLEDNIEEIGNYIRKIMESPDIQYKLKKSISNIVDQNVSKLITNFIPAEAISEKIYLAIEKYINDENSNKDLLLIIKSFLGNIMESNVSELTSGILKQVNPGDLSKYIIDYLGQAENKETIVNTLYKKIKDIDPEIIIQKLSNEIDIIVNGKEIEKETFKFIQEALSQYVDRPVTDILDPLENNFSKIYGYWKIIFHRIAINQLPQIVKLFNVAKIVEDEINKFGVEFTEKLILDIANRELKAITWLGALLGSIMGLLSPLLQML